VYQDLPDATSERILDAARAQLESVGVRHLTVEDVARRARVARVTVYRHYGSKDALVEAVVLREADFFFAQLEAALDGLPAASERLVEGFWIALDYLRNHSLLNRLMVLEAEALVAFITLHGGPLLAAARTSITRLIGREVSEGRLPPLDVDVMAELLVRLVISFFLTPETILRLDTADDAREFARRHLVPVLEGRPAPHPNGAPGTEAVGTGLNSNE
jgi:AcrR family transcriptional regulator